MRLYTFQARTYYTIEGVELMFPVRDPRSEKYIDKEHNLLKSIPNGNGWILARHKMVRERIGLYRRIILKIKIFKKIVS